MPSCKSIFTLSAAAVLLSSTIASAASVTINDVNGVWTSVNPTPVEKLTGVGTNKIDWGRPVHRSRTGGKSGYVFEGAAPPAFDPATGTEFSLGTFTHNNFTIYSSRHNAPPASISGAALEVSINATIDGTSQNIKTTFDFGHWETWNGAYQCANGKRNYRGVNARGCADEVSAVTNLASSNTFKIGNAEYVFDITGFQHNGTTFTSFWTKEGAANSAHLMATLRRVDVPVVPLPAAGWMLMAAVAGLGAAARRRSQS